MLETWQQITCDGCGETDCHAAPNLSRARVRLDYRHYGWRHINSLDYCRQCVEDGKMRRRETIFGTNPHNQTP